ncbi:MAG: T9SS type A sorting domain-containing protein [Paludibacter sp.]|nr:T9SS type A sorting domain-containing protein [Paludibacter sp.]
MNTKNTLKSIFLLAIIVFGFLNVRAQTTANHQWSFMNTDASSKKAFLWIPNSCSSGIRALFIASHTSIEELLVTDSLFRVTAEKEQMAILYTRQDINCSNAPADTIKILNLLNEFAQLSGFTELKYVPWVTWGHSAGTLTATGLGFWKPSRTIAIITHSGNLLIPKWTPKELPNVPFMAIKGQFEEWSVGTNIPSQCGTEYEYNWVRDTVISARKKFISPFLASVTMRPGEGHMGINTKLEIPLITMFIEKSIEKRLPKGVYASNGLIQLNPIAENTGWLSETTIHDYAHLKIDSFPNFSDPTSCYWHLDKEMATMWYNYQNDVTKQTQDLNVRSNPPKVSPTLTFNYGTSTSNDCGMNFSASNFDMSKDYSFSGFTSTSGLPVQLMGTDCLASVTSEGIVKINPCVFDFGTRARLLMRQDGDATYQIRDRQIALTVIKKTSGTTQTVSIASIPACAPGDTITYNATLTSGLTPTVYLLSGPGKMIAGNKIVVLPFVSKTGTTDIVLRAAHLGNTTYKSSDMIELPVVVNSMLPNVPGNISGQSSFLALENNATYSVLSISNATSYQWTVPANATIVSGQGTNTIIVNFIQGFVGGQITVQGVNTNGSSLQSVKEIRIISTGTSEYFVANKFSIYPNPTTGIFSLSGISESTNVSIYNITGELIFNQKVSKDCQINLNSKKGIFVVEVMSSNHNQRFKLLVVE